MDPFVFVTGRDYMVSQSGSVTTLCESLKMFSLPRFWESPTYNAKLKKLF